MRLRLIPWALLDFIIAHEVGLRRFGWIQIGFILGWVIFKWL